MTSVPIAASTPAVHDAEGAAWRATQKDLWVARRDGRHLGTVERGRRYVATDADGEPIGTYRTLEQAMAAVTKQCASARPTAGCGHSWGPLSFVATVIVAAAAMLAAYGLLLL